MALTRGKKRKTTTGATTPLLPASPDENLLNLSHDVLRATILSAAADIGFDGRGPVGLRGYFRACAVESRSTFMSSLLTRCMQALSPPSQSLSIGFTHTRTYENPKDEMLHRLRGLRSRTDAVEMHLRSDGSRISRGLP